jgi:hypothetical protein
MQLANHAVHQVRLAVLRVGDETDQRVVARRELDADLVMRSPAEPRDATDELARGLALEAGREPWAKVGLAFARQILEQYHLVRLCRGVTDPKRLPPGRQHLRREGERVVREGHLDVGRGLLDRGPARLGHRESTHHALRHVGDPIQAGDPAHHGIPPRRQRLNRALRLSRIRAVGTAEHGDPWRRRALDPGRGVRPIRWSPRSLALAYDAAGKTDSAVANYRRTLAVWRAADPSFTNRVQAAQLRLAALTGERVK